MINVYPVTGRFEKSATFLAERVGPFTVYMGDDREAIVERFSNLFADRDRKELIITSRMYRGHTLGLPDEFREKVGVEKADARTVLNMVVKRHEWSPIWTILPSEDRKSILIYF